MNKNQFRDLIREEIKSALKQVGKPLNEGLSLGKMYSVYDPGMDEWNNDYEYLGFDTNTRNHMFRTSGGPGSNNFIFVSIPLSHVNKDVKKNVKEGSLKEGSIKVDPTLKSQLQKAVNAYKRDQEDTIKFDGVVDVLTKIYKKLGQGWQAKELAQGSMEDHRMAWGLSGALQVIKDTMELHTEED